ncbi:hypothetical protein DL93DRAFT_771265 [Clavulina sp. PMI_390]|nr:hypothetical protein DL93DRAFT_771265 [Clavulina sp. PMI_390]
MPRPKLSSLIKRAGMSISLKPRTSSGLAKDAPDKFQTPLGNSAPLPLDDRRLSTSLSMLTCPSILLLPVDLLVEILSHSLLPRDLVSVSHTCQTLRALVDSATVIWAHAWQRDLTMPMAHHPKVLSPTTGDATVADDLMQGDSLPSSQDFPEVQYGSPQPLGFRLPNPQEFSPFDWGSPRWNPYQRRYWNTMRIRRELSSPQPTLKLIGTILKNHPNRELLFMRISEDGDIVVLGFPYGVKIVHLELGVAFSLLIDFQHTLLEDQGLSIPLVSQGACFNGREGVFFASTFRERNEVLLYFVPLDDLNGSPGTSTLKATQVFAEITLPVGCVVQNLMFSGRFLIMKSIHHFGSQSWSYHVFDPSSRSIYRLSGRDTRAVLRTLTGDRLFMFLCYSNEMEIYTLPTSENSPSNVDLELVLISQDTLLKHRPPPRKIHEILLPSAYINPEAQNCLLGVSCQSLHIMEGPAGGGSLEAASTQFWWSETTPKLESRFQTTFPHLTSPHHSPTTQGRVHMPRFLRRHVPTAQVNDFLGAGRIQAGPTSIVICFRPPGKVDVPLIIAHPVFEKGVAGAVEIVQKPILIQARKNKKGQAILKRPDCGVAGHHFNFMWNEGSGRVVLLTSDGDTICLDLYEF